MSKLKFHMGKPKLQMIYEEEVGMSVFLDDGTEVQVPVPIDVPVSWFGRLFNNRWRWRRPNKLAKIWTVPDKYFPF
jgi:hypothetical protein